MNESKTDTAGKEKEVVDFCKKCDGPGHKTENHDRVIAAVRDEPNVEIERLEILK